MENTFIFQVLDVCRCCRLLQHPEYGCNIACAKACECASGPFIRNSYEILLVVVEQLMENTFIFQALDVCRCCRLLQHPEYGCNIACAKACECASGPFIHNNMKFSFGGGGTTTYISCVWNTEIYCL